MNEFACFGSLVASACHDFTVLTYSGHPYFGLYTMLVGSGSLLPLIEAFKMSDMLGGTALVVSMLRGKYSVF